MITRYPKNIFKQIGNVVRYNFPAIILFLILSTSAYVITRVLDIKEAVLPVVPVTILGGGLAIFLGFRNNAAYDRWWEARKIWGAIVNSSRTFAMEILTLMTLRHSRPDNDQPLKELQRRMIYRHLAFINALRLSLRNKNKWDEVKTFIGEDEYNLMLKAPNKATFLNHRQAIDLQYALEQGFVEDFRHMALVTELKDFYNHQGMAERIKKTVFPFYYTYFTAVFLWLFIILLPFSLTGSLNFMSIPLSMAISFIFYILDKSGNITEVPFENTASDTPMTTICKTIEIDLRHMMGETDLPEAEKPKYSAYDVEFYT